MQFPITLGLHRSLFLDRVLFGLMLGGSLVILFYPRDTGLQALLLAIFWGIGIHAWRQLEPAVSALRLARDGSLQALLAGETNYQPVSCLPGATVHPWLSVLRLKLASNRKTTLLIAVDSTNPEDFRRLRVFLRWRAGFNDPVDAA